METRSELEKQLLLLLARVSRLNILGSHPLATEINTCLYKEIDPEFKSFLDKELYQKVLDK